MAVLFDAIYLVAALLTAPWWLWRMKRSGKLRTDWRGRFGHAASLPAKHRPRILFHAVSVGEVNAIRQLIATLAQCDPRPEIIVSVTTNTGYKRACELWHGQHAIARYPFDFSPAVSRFLNAIDPDLVALVELEVWPNFMRLCQRRRIPVAVINGRLTERSALRYRRVRLLVSKAFRAITLVLVQNHRYRVRFENLGVARERILVTGTMKWDTAQIADEVPEASELAVSLGIDPSRPLVVAGSTAPEEHRLLVDAVPTGVQLLCAPRKPEWFDDAAKELAGCVRRTSIEPGKPAAGSTTGRYLLDTIGELRKAYALADVVVIGRSFGTLHGSDMMEPIALGKPTIVGPAVADFQDTVEALLAGGGIVQTTIGGLASEIQRLLTSPQSGRVLAERGREVIRNHQGATAKTAKILLELLSEQSISPASAPPPSD